MALPVYLDYNATTPVAPEVAAAIDPFLRSGFGNPSSDHLYGRHARQAVDHARAQVAALIGAPTGEVVFTGSATEANNLAIFGIARALRGARRHIVTSAIEHLAVMHTCLRLREEGWEVSVVPVDANARLDLTALAAVLRETRSQAPFIADGLPLEQSLLEQGGEHAYPRILGAGRCGTIDHRSGRRGVRWDLRLGACGARG